MNVSNKLLVKIAAIGGIVTCTTGILMNNKCQDKIRHAPYYKASINELRQNKGAMLLLGEPVKEGNFVIRHQECIAGCKEINFEVNLKGQKQKGILYVWMSKQNDFEDWNLKRIELGLNNEPDRRLLIKAEHTEQTS